MKLVRAAAIVLLASVATADDAWKTLPPWRDRAEPGRWEEGRPDPGPHEWDVMPPEEEMRRQMYEDARRAGLVPTFVLCSDLWWPIRWWRCGY